MPDVSLKWRWHTLEKIRLYFSYGRNRNRMCEIPITGTCSVGLTTEVQKIFMRLAFEWKFYRPSSKRDCHRDPLTRSVD